MPARALRRYYLRLGSALATLRLVAHLVAALLARATLGALLSFAVIVLRMLLPLTALLLATLLLAALTLLATLVLAALILVRHNILANDSRR